MPDEIESDEREQHERAERDDAHDDEAREERPRRTGGQAEGEPDEEDDTRPVEVPRPSQAEG